MATETLRAESAQSNPEQLQPVTLTGEQAEAVANMLRVAHRTQSLLAAIQWNDPFSGPLEESRSADAARARDGFSALLTAAYRDLRGATQSRAWDEATQALLDANHEVYD